MFYFTDLRPAVTIAAHEQDLAASDPAVAGAAAYRGSAAGQDGPPRLGLAQGGGRCAAVDADLRRGAGARSPRRADSRRRPAARYRRVRRGAAGGLRGLDHRSLLAALPAGRSRGTALPAAARLDAGARFAGACSGPPAAARGSVDRHQPDAAPVAALLRRATGGANGGTQEVPVRTRRRRCTARRSDPAWSGIRHALAGRDAQPRGAARRAAARAGRAGVTGRRGAAQVRAIPTTRLADSGHGGSDTGVGPAARGRRKPRRWHRRRLHCCCWPPWQRLLS
jgi:hypothetical protein